MFHTYVLNAQKVLIDIDRASFLMDKKIWFEVCTELALNPHYPDEMDKALHLEHFGKPHPEPLRPDPQACWSEYCRRHEAKYGAPFSPETMTEPL